jgi:CubicO group peptidase (beta-lactamase class C family)
MKNFFIKNIILSTICLFAVAQQQPFDLPVVDPGIFRIDPDMLQAHADELFRRDTKAYMIIASDKIVYERYAADFDRYKTHYTASAAKGIMGGLSLMLAMHDGLIDLDDLACKYIPQWKDDPLKSKITIRMLGAHTSGIDDAVDTGVKLGSDTSGRFDFSDWKGDFWKQEPNPFLLSRDVAPVIFAPGTDFMYSNPGIGMLSYAVTVAIKDTEYKDLRTYLWERIIKKIGIPQQEWYMGYGKIFELDGLPLVATWGGGGVSTRAMAAVGRLLLHKGAWNGEQLISAKVVEKALKHSGTPSYCSCGFWLNADLAGNKYWPDLPWDVAMAAGAQDQMMLFSSARNLIVVRFGGSLEPDNYAEGVVNKYIGIPLAKAMGDLAPYPRSKKITDIHWAPAGTIVRLATGEAVRDGSDNWPMTWAQDDCLYTAYGDGYGFEPSLPHKLGMGFGKIRGEPDHFNYENIRSDAENQSWGGAGEKASGLLAMDDNIYLWVRNANQKGEQSRLACSNDHQKTWTWCDWRFEEFGHIAFVNYGKNYQGARDNYVYMASHDNPSAYAVSDHFVLLRAPKDKLMDRSAYEFYKGSDNNGRPLWTKDVRQRQPVFTNPQKCCRSSISYHPGTGRYLWWQQLPNTGDIDTRYSGGLGIFEAPEPWGPWTTAYYAEKWDVGVGDLGCFPTKWMSEDGKTLYLVFSGNDNFSLRKATLIFNLKEK